jgi:hypothetical protein
MSFRRLKFQHLGEGTNRRQAGSHRNRTKWHDRTSEIGFTRCNETKKFKAKGCDGKSAKDDPSQDGIEALVTARHARERRPGLASWRLCATRSEADRRLAQAFRGTQFAPQGRRLSLGGFDADLLHQSRRQDAAKDAAAAIKPHGYWS